ncbi:MMPL family transporter [Nocardia brasiliensis]|uniref:MMPL family transporter n=1 Tax=Nocardia brasiliensis TaxID=37326 RepID=UPI003D92F9CE
MARLLYNLGASCFRHRWAVVAGWLVLLLVTGLLALLHGGSPTNSFVVPGTEAQSSVELINSRMPQAYAGGATARVAVRATPGARVTDPATAVAIGQAVGVVRALDHVGSVLNPLEPGSPGISLDGRVAMLVVTYDISSGALTAADRHALDGAVAPLRDAGLEVEIGGTAREEPIPTSPLELAGLLVALLILTATFRAVLVAGLNMLTAIAGVGVVTFVIMVTASIVELHLTAPVLATMIGLAVGIDYALLILSRYRAELAHSPTRQDAAGRSVATAGSAVLVAGATVLIALAGLTVVGIPFLSGMGLAASIAVAIAVLVALTLLPALLGVADQRITPNVLPEAASRGRNGRWIRIVARYPVGVIAVCVGLLGVLTLPVVGMATGLPNDETMPPSSGRHQAADILTSGFVAGVNGPLAVAIDLGASPDPTHTTSQFAQQLRGLTGVAAVLPPVFDAAHDLAIITVIPTTGPSSAATRDLVDRIRGTAPEVRAASGARVTVTGDVALAMDTSRKLGAALPIYLSIVVALTLVLLTVFFRSLIVPLIAAAGFLLTVGAALGCATAVIQWGWLADVFSVDQPGPLICVLPILVTGVLYGLAMDYQVFLTTRIGEQQRGGASPAAAVTTGYTHSARVIVAAAAIMVAVFGGFAWAQDQIVQALGFTLAVGVLVDAFVVRLTLVPAAILVFGRAAWWLPDRLRRVLPELDLDGSRFDGAAAGAASPPSPVGTEK